MKNNLIRTSISMLPTFVLLIIGISFITSIIPKAFGQIEEPTTFAVKISLHGIGNSGDSINPTNAKLSNKDPDTILRGITVSVYNANNQLVSTRPGNVAYNYDMNVYTGLIDMGTLPSGTYIIKIKATKYLQRRVTGTVNVTKGATVAIPTVTLTAGDINSDNKIDILDYNILRGCYSDILPPAFCDDTRLILSDLSDDGRVDALDYSLFIREIGQYGD